MFGRMFGIGNFGIITKLAIMLMPPIISLIYYTFSGYIEIQSNIRALERLVNLASVSVQIGETIHATQKERGRTTTFLSAKGSTFATELQTTRDTTDQKITLLRDSFKQLQGKQYSGSFDKNIQQALTMMEQLKPIRQTIDTLTIDETAAIRYYTDLNALLIHLLDDSTINEGQNNLQNHLQTYVMLLQSKELLGLERAETGPPLQRKELSRRKLVELVQLNTKQITFINRFLNLGGDEYRILFNKKMDAECVVEVDRIQKNLFNGTAITELNIDPSRWFDLITCKIDRYKEIEDYLVERIQTQIEQELTAHRHEIITFISLNTSAITFTLLIVLLITRHLTTHTKRVVETMKLFSSGQLDIRLPVTFHDELGQIASSFNEMARRIEQNALQEKAAAELERQTSEQFRQRIQMLKNALTQVSNGDLTIRVDAQGEDELANLGKNLNQMITSLATMTRQTEEAIQSLSSALTQVQDAAQAHSSGASQQAAAINETTTTLEEIRAVASQTLEKAQAMGRIAETARSEGEKGNHAAKQTLLSMDAIRSKVGAIATTILALSDKTSRISEITMAVNNLAQQSKMLALNASIEAAKAGDAGKGFAVVADEVKNLAEQSQQFTSQVQRILEEIRHATDRAVMATEEGSKEVDQGAALTKQAGAVVQNLLELLKEAAISGQQIVAAVRQESAGIDQIGAAMNEINQVTTQSVTSTRQTVQATENLGKLSARLQESNRFYKV
ncbi:MAG: nitrate- and nitrite sensing domain-containing protein [Magnetococcales bacterium]|nr:nitrate- and nitrite sensing domain-containing protein [Magnetococcales bacterium]MBF0437700.1 nitrate- and nitrite sensing domain-containing protein [Magnetococcales bacterium]